MGTAIIWICFGIYVIFLVVLLDTELTAVPDVLAYIVAAIGGLLFFVGAYKYKKEKIGEDL